MSENATSELVRLRGKRAATYIAVNILDGYTTPSFMIEMLEVAVMADDALISALDADAARLQAALGLAVGALEFIMVQADEVCSPYAAEKLLEIKAAQQTAAKGRGKDDE